MASALGCTSALGLILAAGVTAQALMTPLASAASQTTSHCAFLKNGEAFRGTCGVLKSFRHCIRSACDFCVLSSLCRLAADWLAEGDPEGLREPWAYS